MEDDDLDSMFDDDTPTPEGVAGAVVETPTEEKPAPEKEADGEKEAPPVAPQPPEPPKEELPPAQPQPPVEDQPAKPLTAEEVRQILANEREQDRNSAKLIEEAEQEVLNAYYPQGLSNTLIDEKSGKEIKSPQDVVDLSGGSMTIEEASQWLMNEQYKLDKQVAEIKQSARELAETNANFKQGAERVLSKYQPIFDKYPQLQGKVYRNYMKTVKMDAEKDLILSAPDIEDYYADVMEPYVMAFSYQQSQQAAPAAAPAQAIPESKQTAADRMDVSGDGGGGGDGGDADPNDPDATLNKFFGE